MSETRYIILVLHQDVSHVRFTAEDDSDALLEATAQIYTNRQDVRWLEGLVLLLNEESGEVVRILTQRLSVSES